MTKNRTARNLDSGDTIWVDGRPVHVQETRPAACFTPVTSVHTDQGAALYFLTDEEPDDAHTVTRTCPLCEKHRNEEDGDQFTVTGTVAAVDALMVDHLALLDEHDSSEIAEHIVKGMR